MAGLQKDNVVKTEMSVETMKNQAQTESDSNATLLKRRQEYLAKEYRELAKSFSEIRSDKAKYLLTKLKLNKSSSMFQEMFDERDAVFERMRKAVNMRYEYESKMVKNVTRGEIRNVHLQFYKNKNMVQQDLMREVHQQIADLEREHWLCRYPAVTVRQTVVRNLQAAHNMPEFFTIRGLSSQEADDDLKFIKSGKVIDMVDQICETELWGDSLDSSRKGVISVPSYDIEERKKAVLAEAVQMGVTVKPDEDLTVPGNVLSIPPPQVNLATIPVTKREYEQEVTSSEPRSKKVRSVSNNTYEAENTESYKQAYVAQAPPMEVPEPRKQRVEQEQQPQFVSQHLMQSQILPPPPRPSQTLMGPSRTAYQEPKDSHLGARLPPPPPPAPVTYNQAYGQTMHLPPVSAGAERQPAYGYYGSYPSFQPAMSSAGIQLPPFNEPIGQGYSREHQQLAQYGYILPPPPPPPPQPPVGDEQKGEQAHGQVPQDQNGQYQYAYTYDGRYPSRYPYRTAPPPPPPPSQVR